jgi:hypothetical protein
VVVAGRILSGPPPTSHDRLISAPPKLSRTSSPSASRRSRPGSPRSAPRSSTTSPGPTRPPPETYREGPKRRAAGRSGGKRTAGGGACLRVSPPAGPCKGGNMETTATATALQLAADLRRLGFVPEAGVVKGGAGRGLAGGWPGARPSRRIAAGRGLQGVGTPTPRPGAFSPGRRARPAGPVTFSLADRRVGQATNPRRDLLRGEPASPCRVTPAFFCARPRGPVTFSRAGRRGRQQPAGPHRAGVIHRVAPAFPCARCAGVQRAEGARRAGPHAHAPGSSHADHRTSQEQDALDRLLALGRQGAEPTTPACRRPHGAPFRPPEE